MLVLAVLPCILLDQIRANTLLFLTFQQDGQLSSLDRKQSACSLNEFYAQILLAVTSSTFGDAGIIYSLCLNLF